MKVLMMLSLLFCANSHPVALILILIMTSIFSSLLISTLLKSSWLSLIFILIMLGGMLILFIYIASLASNEPFLKSKMIYFIPFVIILPPYKGLNKFNFSDTQLFMLFSTNNSFNNCGAILYLLLSLLVVIEIISCYKSPLRSSV
uniref:NADH dehydrogenase subunit 6 n=1 Tax=Cycetogamasus diviortus TaxID=2978624 RepID=UPI0022F2FBEF|nr:NADH dehydrogenase subunit 6 [Cycetogamasus diviortus]WAK85131.1 NADH dehydrogenase subunit 6 [Cycetogamasus diviortus]